MFPEESRVREEATLAGWSETGWALLFESPEDELLTLRVYPSFFTEEVTPAFLVVETLEGDPARAPVGLQVWVSKRIPTPEEARSILDREGVVCRVGDLMPEDLTVEGRL